MKTDILGMKIDTYTVKETFDICVGFLNDGKRHSVYTPNPEFVMLGRKDPEFMEIINRGSLVIPDGIGVVFASRLTKVKIRERVPGYDLCESLLLYASKNNKTVYFFGSKPGVAELAKRKVEERFPGIRIVGVSDGYFEEDKKKLIIKDICDKSPDILLVGMSASPSARFIDTHLPELPVSIAIGAGGTLDGLAGVVKRAPKFFQRLNIEWLYRLISQPTRIKRQIFIPLFMFTVIADKFKRKAGNDR